MNKGLKLLLVTLPIAALGAGILAYVVSTSKPPERIALSERAIAVRVITAETRQVTPRIVGFGLVRPARTYEAIAQVGGTVDYVNPDLKKGAILPAGAVLVRLSQADFTLAVAQAKANIRAAEARLAEIAVSQENQTASLAIEAEVLALKAGDLARAEQLFTAGTASQSARDAARAAHLAQRQKVQGIESALALLPTQRTVQTEQIAVYQANFETAELNLARTVLTLPFAARVAASSVEVGQFVGAGRTVASLDGIDAAEVEVQVPVAKLRGLLLAAQADAGTLTLDPTSMTAVLRNLDLGAEVRLQLDTETMRWSARVDRISDTIDQKTGTLGVIVRVESAYSAAEIGSRPPLTKGMFVEAELSGPPVSGLVVPRSALRDGQLYIADADSRLNRVPALPYLVQDDIAVLAEGPPPGTRIVVSALSPAIDGMLLDLTEDRALRDDLAEEGPLQ